MPQLGDILSELREDRGLTQLQLAEILHISNSSISAYETGARMPSIETLVSFSRFFDVSADYLLGLTSKTLPPSVLSEELLEGMTVGAVIESLKALSPEQRSAVVLTLENMRFYADITGRTEHGGSRAK